MNKILLACLLLAHQLNHAQNSLVKDAQLKMLIDQAIHHFPKIIELQAQTKQYAIKDELAKTGYQPTIAGNASIAVIDPIPFINAGGGKINFAPRDNYNAAISINQLIYDFGKIKWQLQRNKAEEKLTNATIDNSKNALAFQVAQVYYSLQLFTKAIAVQQEQIAALKSNEQLIQAKLNNGDALKYDLLTTQVRTANATNRLLDLQTQLGKQYTVLQWLTGVDQKNTLTLLQPYDALPLITDAATALSVNSEAQILQKRIDLINYDTKAAYLNDKPTVFASAAGGIKNGYQPTIQPLKLNGTLAVGINVPIFNGGKPKLAERLNNVQVNATKAMLATLQSSIEKDLQLNQQDYLLLTEKLKSTNLIVTQSQKAFDIGNVRFKNGLITNAELLLVQTTVEDAKLQQVQLQYQLQLASLESHKILGEKFY